MFIHEKSKQCSHGRKCYLKLCQYQHNDNEQDFKCEICEYITKNENELKQHEKEKHEFRKYEEMDDGEKYEVQDFICYNICWQGDHKCLEKEEENELLGIDVFRIKQDFRNCVEEESFKCEMCDYTGYEMKDVKEHFLKTHRHEHQVKCWICDKKVKTIFDLSKHVGTYHYTSQSESEN